MMTLQSSVQARVLQEKVPPSAILVEFFAVFAQGK